MALRLLEPAAGGTISAEHPRYSRLVLWIGQDEIMGGAIILAIRE